MSHSTFLHRENGEIQDSCPRCGSQIDKDSVGDYGAKCWTCEKVSQLDELITENDDYEWCQ